jgi:hypothetical protein
MTEIDAQEVTPSGMSLETALTIAAQIRLAGFHADQPHEVLWRGSEKAYAVSFESNAGWDVIFTVDQWQTHPDNPNRAEPPNW